MSEDLQKAESRLQNIRTVAPILAALRTISLSGWQVAARRRELLKAYLSQYWELGAPLAAQLLAAARSQRVASSVVGRSGEPGAVLLLVVGSERGLCGRYNKVLLDRLEALREGAGEGCALRYAALGRRMIRSLEQRSLALEWSRALSLTSLPPYSLAESLIAQWLERYEAGELDAVDVLYNAPGGGMSYQSAVVRVVPPVLGGGILSGDQGLVTQPWPSILIDGDPEALLRRWLSQWMVVSLYTLFVEAAVSERSARYQLMESATQNANRLIADLVIVAQAARRQAITNETRELAIGAGLLDSSSSPTDQ